MVAGHRLVCGMHRKYISVASYQSSNLSKLYNILLEGVTLWHTKSRSTSQSDTSISNESESLNWSHTLDQIPKDSRCTLSLTCRCGDAVIGLIRVFPLTFIHELCEYITTERSAYARRTPIQLLQISEFIWQWNLSLRLVPHPGGMSERQPCKINWFKLQIACMVSSENNRLLSSFVTFPHFSPNASSFLNITFDAGVFCICLVPLSPLWWKTSWRSAIQLWNLLCCFDNVLVILWVAWKISNLTAAWFPKIDCILFFNL